MVILPKKSLGVLAAALFGGLPLACQRTADSDLQKYLSAGQTGTAIVAYPTGTIAVGDTPTPPTHATNLRDKLRESGMTSHLRAVPNGQFLSGLLLNHDTDPAGSNLSIFYVDSDNTLQANERSGLERVADTYSGVGTNTTIYSLTPSGDGFSRFNTIIERKRKYQGGN